MMDSVDLNNETYFIPSAAFDPVGTWDMKALAAALHKAAKCRTFQATNTTLNFRSTGQLRLQVVCNITSEECLRSPVLVP